jgi:putative ABC transport system ATP-binding protein
MPPLSLASSSDAPLASSSEARRLLIDAYQLQRHASDSGACLLYPLSLHLHGGDRLAVTGPSGAGKSVLLRLLALLDAPDGGQIRWCGVAVDRRTILGYRRSVAYLKQRATMLDGSVADNLRAPFALKIYRDLHYSAQTVLHLLAAADRDASFLQKNAAELSGGEAQITALVRVLQLAPTVLLLDEPTAALDPVSQAIVEAMVDRWFAAVPGRALAWISHDPAQAARIGNRSLHLAAGRIQPRDSIAAKLQPSQ